MKIKSFLLAVTMLIGLSSCGQIEYGEEEKNLTTEASEEITDTDSSSEDAEETVTEEDVEKTCLDILQSDPRFIEISPETEVYRKVSVKKDETGKETEKEEVYYNKFEDPLRRIYYDHEYDEVNTTTYSYTYDEDNNIIFSRTEYNHSDMVSVFENTYEYDENGHRIYSESITDGKEKTISHMEYDENGTKIKITIETYSSPDSTAPDKTETEITEAVYDDNGNRILYTTYNDDGSKKISVKHTYDDETGLLMNVTSSYYALGQTEETVYTYNEFNQRVLSDSKTYNSDNEIVDDFRMETTFDPDTHFKVSYKTISHHTNKYTEGSSESCSTLFFDEYGDDVRQIESDDSNYYDNRYQMNSETIKEYLVSDDITDLFKSYYKMLSEKKFARLLASLNRSSEEEAEETTQETETSETSTSSTSSTSTSSETASTESEASTETTSESVTEAVSETAAEETA